MEEKNKYYYSGGLAELNTSPSELTFKYFEKWFSGAGSLGKAMGILGLPVQKKSISNLVLIDHILFVDLKKEEELFFKNTIFKYQPLPSAHDRPTLGISWVKIINPFIIFNTIKILITQSIWIAFPEKILMKMQKLIGGIEEHDVLDSSEEIDSILCDEIWPAVIAIGMLSEFYSTYLERELNKESNEVNEFISYEVAKRDWFLSSLTDQDRVRTRKISFEEYFKRYGMRSDKDYELTEPRWHELKDQIKKRITESTKLSEKSVMVPEVNKKIRKMIDVSIEFQILRSEAKRKILIYFDVLRQQLIDEQKLSSGSNTKVTSHSIVINRSNDSNTSHVGTSVSGGIVRGVSMRVKDNTVMIPKGIIGIFPNASTEFTIQFPKCAGIIFLRGGQTSHGAIVAREFGIPAIIDEEASEIGDEKKIELNGTKGSWKIIS